MDTLKLTLTVTTPDSETALNALRRALAGFAEDMHDDSGPTTFELTENLGNQTGEALPQVLIVGNPVDGISIVGPFADAPAASEYAERNTEDYATWWSTDLHPAIES